MYYINVVCEKDLRDNVIQDNMSFQKQSKQCDTPHFFYKS